MSSTMKLKDEARRYEQQEDWGRAIELYRHALEEQESGDAELGLYNRIGDLYLRLGETGSAVEYYVQAADRYTEAGFLNNAIALCNKALRYEPDRTPLYEKLGRLCAEQGFLTDARRWYLEYAERLASSGRMDESLGALQEFAELTQDADVWATLGRQYAAQGRSGEAVTALTRAAEAYVAGGDLEAAQAVEDEGRAIDPSFEAPASSPAPAVESVDSPLALGTADEEERDLGPSEAGGLAVDTADSVVAVPGDDEAFYDGSDVGRPDAYEADLVDFDSSAGAEGDDDSDVVRGLDLEGAGVDVDPLEVAPVAGLEGGYDGDDGAYTTLSVDSLLEDDPDYAGAVGVGGGAEADLGSAAATAGSADVDGDAPLPFLDPDDGPMPMPEWTDVGDAPTDVATAPEVEEPTPPIVVGGDAEADEDDLLDDLPIFDLEAEAESAVHSGALADGPVIASTESAPWASPAIGTDELAEDALADALDPAEDVPADAVDPAEGALAGAIPEEFRAPKTPEDRARAFLAEGREDDALDILEHAAGAAEERDATQEAERLTALMVELAPRSLRALRARAGAVERAGGGPEAVPAYSALADALSKSGDEDAARSYYERILAIDPEHEAARGAVAAAHPAPTGGDYVDLADLVGEETLETTRFVVEEEVPTGDEDQDFHEMLSQFRSKVSEHVSVEDSASHYDLGIAFKEMGLIDEAIAEFQTALRFGSQRLKVYEELGQCFMEKGDYAIAEKLLHQGSNEMATDPNELLGVNYHLGRCYEALERPDDAREAYERVLSLDYDFRDVSERLERL